MAECAPLTGATNLSPSCGALRKRGGADKTAYLLSISQIAGITLDPVTKELTGIALKTGEKALKITGRKLKNATTYSMTQAEFGPNYSHGYNFEAFYDSQAEKESIEKMALSDELVIIAPLNSGQIEAFGLVSTYGLADGLKMEIGEGGSGVNYEDKTSMSLNFTGGSDKLPVFCKFGVDRAANIDYLEDLLVAAA